MKQARSRPESKTKAKRRPTSDPKARTTPGSESKQPRSKSNRKAKSQPSPIGILHGYLLDGSGSNLWTQAVVRALCRAGNDVHLLCQEPHPEQFEFVARAIRYDGPARPAVLFERDVPYPGGCTVHRPDLGGILPVYVEDRYEEHQRVIPMIKLDDDLIEDYVARNTAVLERVVEEHRLTALHANHAVLMPVVARRVARDRAIPFTIMPHGSAIEYAVKRDARFHRMASQALRRAGRVFVIGPEIRGRLGSVFPPVSRDSRRSSSTCRSASTPGGSRRSKGRSAVTASSGWPNRCGSPPVPQHTRGPMPIARRSWEVSTGPPAGTSSTSDGSLQRRGRRRSSRRCRRSCSRSRRRG